jgi:GMP synthase-like glutamine amidotransferase
LRVLAVVNELDAGAGVFAGPVTAAGHELVEWVPWRESMPAIDDVGAAMVFGGSMNVDEEAQHPWLVPEKELLRDLVARDVPTLGVCLGSQLLAEAAGAQPRRAARPEIGWHAVELTAEAPDDPLLGALPPRFEALQWHSFEAPLPPGATALAQSPVCLQAYRLAGGRSWGVQFHPEVTATDLGTWLDHHRDDADAVRLGIDPEAIRAETATRIKAWNDLGRGIAARFLAAAL